MKFQNLILDLLRVLPKKLIQYLAGPPIIIDGNTLDPNMQIIAKLIPQEQQEILISPKSLRKATKKLDELAIKNNWAGIIVNGCIRDIQILRHMNLGIYALGSCPKKSNKNGKGQINATFSVDEVDIKPGYWIYADQNGILISTKQLES